MPLLTASIWIVLSFPSLYPSMNSKLGLAGRRITVFVIVGLPLFKLPKNYSSSYTLQVSESRLVGQIAAFRYQWAWLYSVHTEGF
jgi:hypothetical protein